MTAFPVTFPAEREPMSLCFVRVETADGLVGWGEACDSYGCTFAGVVATAVTDALAPLLVGRSVVAVDAEAERLRAWTRRRLGDEGVGAPARSAVEIALWDLAGQRAGLPVGALLGQARAAVPVYASVGFLEEGDAAWQLRSLEPLLEAGVRMAKVRLGPAWAADLDTLVGLRAALDPSIELMIDGSETFTLPTARRIADRLAELGIGWFEEPLPQTASAGIEELARSSPVAIAYGEHLFSFDAALDALRHHRLSVLQPDASSCGGIAEARRIAELGHAFGARIVPHCCAGPVALAANLHLAASQPWISAIEYPPSMVGAWDHLGTGSPLGPTALVDGCLPVPASPGLGVGIDEDAARALPYRPPRRLTGVRAAPGPGPVGPALLDGRPDRFGGDR